MNAAIFDIETDGLLDSVTTVHCLVIRDKEGAHRYHGTEGLPREGELIDGVRKLDNYEKLIGHNVANFDIPVLGRITGWAPAPHTLIHDTLVLSRLIFPHVKKLDFLRLNKNPDFPKDCIGKHSLKAWGLRLGCPKNDFDVVGLKELTEEALEYCVQDTETNLKLYQMLMGREPSERSIELETAFAKHIEAMMRRGVGFDEKGAEELVAKLMIRRAELDVELQKLFPPLVVEYVTPKRKEKKTKLKAFNANSRDHIAERLELQGWKPVEYTPSGKPELSEEILRALPYPEAPTLADRFKIVKLLGQVAEGNEAWVRHSKNGRIHGFVNHNGTRTSRCIHSRPNLGQVDAGPEARTLFIPREGWDFVGADASGIQLRCLAHYLACYDGGAYARALLEGDIHTVNQEAAGISTRDRAKTFIYAFLFGAGDEKLGSIDGGGKAEGKELKRRFFKRLPALGRLKQDVEAAAMQKKCLLGLDGRRLPVFAKHTALNTLLMGAEAVLMKQATVNLHEMAEGGGLVEDVDWGMVLHVHDEFQSESRPEVSQDLGEMKVASIRLAGTQFELRCPLDGEFRIGRNWQETH